MIKKIKNFLKKLFDFQRFEKNPKLDQTIKDTFNEKESKLSDLDLSKVAGGNYSSGDSVLGFYIKCPRCGCDTYRKLSFGGMDEGFCYHCNYSGPSTK